MSENSVELSDGGTAAPGAVRGFRERLQSYPLLWSGRKDKEVLARAGFTYTGTGDQVVCKQCYLKLLNWIPTDDALREHATRRPGCPFITGNYSDGVPPKHPKYQTLTTRLESFADWPSRYVPKTPEELAEAGFFYIGSADRVTCFQCGTTLRDWEAEHDPVVEHQRYSNVCPFIHKPDLNLLGVATRTQSGDNQASGGGAGIESAVDTEKGFVHGTTTQAESSVAKSSLQSGDGGLLPTDFGTTPTGEAALEHPTSAETFPMPNPRVQPGTRCLPAESKAMPSLCAGLEAASLEGQHSSDEGHTSSPDHPEASRSAVDENRRLRKKHMCRICKVKMASILFLPCGHILACEDCQSRVSECLRCGKAIRGTVKTYLS